MDKGKVCKVVLVGEAGVGKTSLISRFVENKFPLSHSPTISSSFISKDIILDGNQLYTLNIWDTSGQEMFRPITNIFLRGAGIIVMVYDITNRKSFDEIKYFWLNKILQENDKIIIGICGNKYDLILNEEVPIEEGKDFAKGCNAVFSTVSAIDGTGVNNFFYQLVQRFENDQFSQEQLIERAPSFYLKKDLKEKKRTNCFICDEK